jgi:hypothetical protein
LWYKDILGEVWELSLGSKLIKLPVITYQPVGLSFVNGGGKWILLNKRKKAKAHYLPSRHEKPVSLA